MDSQRLARAVKDARGTHSQAEVLARARQAGHKISIQAWRNVEAGAHASYWDSTLAAVDAGVGWPEGTAKTILAGGLVPDAVTVPAVDNGLMARLARLEAQVALGGDERQMTDLQAVGVVLRCLSDDQFRIVVYAVRQDDRYRSAAR